MQAVELIHEQISYTNIEMETIFKMLGQFWMINWIQQLLDH